MLPPGQTFCTVNGLPQPMLFWEVFRRLFIAEVTGGFIVLMFAVPIMAKQNPPESLSCSGSSTPTRKCLNGFLEGVALATISLPLLSSAMTGYVAVGQDPEHGEGIGHLWCIDPTKRGDVSPELAFNASDPQLPVSPKRIQAVVEEDGDFARANPNSAVIWHYSEYDQNGDGEIDFEETMHRSCGTVAILSLIHI